MTECEQIIKDLPHHPAIYENCKASPNAYVFVDEAGEVHIFPVDGGTVWSRKETFNGDLAPWCD